MLDGIADVPPDYPFPKTALARLMEHALDRARADRADPRTLDMGERVLSAVREQAEAEHFQ